MTTKSFYYAAFAMQFLEKVLGSRFSVTGLEKLPKKPVLFVANHFTRSETFFIPYLIYKHTDRQVRCLADSGLYFGALGNFLRRVGTVSTKDPRRDHIILKDLIKGEYDWMIYPEGSMVKSKETRNEALFVNYTPYRVGPVRTGAAVVALKSQLYRSDIIEAFEKNDQATLQQFERDFDVKFDPSLKDINTQIVPLSITYYPIRPGNNPIENLAHRLVKAIPSQVSEELEIEGNLLLNSEINVSFGDPINLADYIKKTRDVILQIPIIKGETKNNFILRYFKSTLTNEFMSKIYSDVQVNFDHIFSAALHHFSEGEVEINRLKRVIYLSASMLRKSGKYRLNHSLFEENIYKIFCDEPHEEFDSVFELAKKQGLIEEIPGDQIRINRSSFDKKYDFHEIRRENTLQVIANEFFLLEAANALVKRNAKTPDEDLRKKVFAELQRIDMDAFNADYAKYFDEKFSKDKSVGAPFFLDTKVKASSRVRRVGIMLVHGYKSAPKEVEALAKYLNGFGFRVYAVRLKGHGTAPRNLHDVSWQDWYDSTNRAYAALQNISSRIVMVGFSTGGLLSLLSAAKKAPRAKKIAGIISINSALKLVDIKARMVPGINWWNEMLDKLHIEKGHLEYVDDVPENPQINYSRNYIHGVNELEKLMEVCEDNLGKILANALIIQGTKDPVVSPLSGKIIYDKIHSKEKQLAEVDFSNHVIINSERKEEVFELIKNFLFKTKYS